MKKIAFISQPEYFRFTYENDLDENFEVVEFPFNYTMKPDQFKSLIDFNADYNVFFRGEFFPEETLKKVRGIKINLSSEPFPRKIGNKWEQTKDSINRFNQFKKIKNKNFDYVFHYDISSLPLFLKNNLNISGEFYFPVALKTYKPLNRDKKWDLFFIGRSTNHRESLFGKLKHYYNFLHIAHGVWGHDLVDYISQSRICLNAHAENEISWEPRMQMMLAAGAFVLSEKITPNNYLRPGIDYIEYSGNIDLYNKVEYYLKNENERNIIIKNAQQRISEYFDSKKNFTNLFNGIENNLFQKFNIKTKTNYFKNLLLNFYGIIKNII